MDILTALLCECAEWRLVRIRDVGQEGSHLGL